MANIVYALAGYGRGHSSRALACAAILRAEGHRMTFCCGGPAKVRLEALGEHVIDVPALKPAIHGNRGDLLNTVVRNAKAFGLGPDFVRLVSQLEAAKPQLLLADFEPFAPAAADMLGLPVVTLNHQQIVTETRYPVPPRYRLSALATGAAIRALCPYRTHHSLISSFYFPPLKRPRQATLLGPLLRQEVLALKPKRGEHFLVYFNGGSGLEGLVERLANVDASFTVYNVNAPQQTPANVIFKRPSPSFLEDLAQCRGVICTAGFNLISEALFLNKPLLVTPNRGFFEQTLNALYVERDGWGRASYDDLPSLDMLKTFVAGATSETPNRNPLISGNAALAEAINGLLGRLGRASWPSYSPQRGTRVRPS